jgi:hypothetical protein
MPDMNENAETQQEYFGKVKKISAEDLQDKNTVSYKLGEIMELDADFVTLLNFVDWYSPRKEVNEKLTKIIRHIAGQIGTIEKDAKSIIQEGLAVMFRDGGSYDPAQVEYYNKATHFLKL